jgi:hypothetical protein
MGLVLMIGQAVTYHILRTFQDGPSEATVLADVFD